MNVKPLGDRVLLKVKEKVEKTSSGIYLPDSAKEDSKEGEVVAVGSLKENGAVSVGDVVIYGGYSNEEVEVNGKKHVIVEFKDLIAKME